MIYSVYLSPKYEISLSVLPVKKARICRKTGMGIWNQKALNHFMEFLTFVLKDSISLFREAK
jgi:hypothetical protein